MDEKNQAAYDKLVHYDMDTIKQMTISLEILGRPLFQILDGLPDNLATSLLSMLDMIVENSVAGDLESAYTLKKGLRASEEIYMLYQDEQFQANLNNMLVTNKLHPADEDEVPAILQDGALLKHFKYDTISYYSPSFEEDLKRIEERMKLMADQLKSMIDRKFQITIESCEAQFGLAPAGQYERGLEGVRVKFKFKN